MVEKARKIYAILEKKVYLISPIPLILNQRWMQTPSALIVGTSDPPKGPKVSYIWFPIAGANPHYKQAFAFELKLASL
jgi:hypothetical protein